MKNKMLVLLTAVLIAACVRDSRMYTSSAGTFTLSGPALAKYRELGEEKGALGYPVSSPRTTQSGDAQTLFEHGFINVSASGAAEAVTFPNAMFSTTGVDIADETSGDDFALAPLAGPTGDVFDVNCFCEGAGRIGTEPRSCGPAMVRRSGRNTITVRCPTPVSCTCRPEFVRRVR